MAAESWTIDHNRVQVGAAGQRSRSPGYTAVAPLECTWKPASRAIDLCHHQATTRHHNPRLYCPQVGRGQAAYRRARSLLEQWRHFDLGWASVNAPPVKPGSPVVVTAFSLCCWSCNPLRISFVEEGGLRRNAQQLPPWVGAPPTAAEGASLRQQRLHGGGSGVLGLLGTGGGKRTQHQQQAAAAEAAAALPPRGRRFAFAHTTLQGHQIRGEERFCVAWNAQDDSGAQPGGLWWRGPACPPASRPSAPVRAPATRLCCIKPRPPHS